MNTEKPKFASELSQVEGADYFMVRTRWTWGRDKNLREAIKLANAGTGDEVHVCRCDGEAECDGVDGSIRYNVRGAIWRGRITRRHSDVRLSQMTHPIQAKAKDA